MASQSNAVDGKYTMLYKSIYAQKEILDNTLYYAKLTQHFKLSYSYSYLIKGFHGDRAPVELIDS